MLVSATNGKTTTAAMVAEILSPRLRLAHNRAGANLLSGVASTLLSARDAELGLFEVDEAALPEVRAACGPARWRSATSSATSSTATASSSTSPSAGARRSASSIPRRWVVVNADDPQVGDLARERERRLLFGLDDPRHASPTLQHAADSKWCLVCGTPYEYAAAYVGHLGDYRCPACGHARPQLDVVAREIELGGLERRRVRARHARGRRPGVAAAARPLQRLQRPCGRLRWRSRSTSPLDEVVAGLERFSAAFGRFERIAVGDRTLVVLLVKNPAGANEAVRTLVAGGAPRSSWSR